MNDRPPVHTGAIISGLFFVIVGVALLLDRLGVITVRLRMLWPLLLIGIGVAVLLSGRGRVEPPGPPPE